MSAIASVEAGQLEVVGTGPPAIAIAGGPSREQVRAGPGEPHEGAALVHGGTSLQGNSRFDQTNTDLPNCQEAFRGPHVQVRHPFS
jgi:hypothetical protein